MIVTQLVSAVYGIHRFAMGSQDTFYQFNPICFPTKSSDIQLSCICDTYTVRLALPELTTLVTVHLIKSGMQIYKNKIFLELSVTLQYSVYYE